MDIVLEHVFQYLRRNRELFIELVDSLSIEQLNQIPKGFNNNIAWNFGHAVVTPQALYYVRSGVKPDMQIAYFDKYKKGSKPEDFITQEEIDEIKKLAFSTIDTIEADINNNAFTGIKPFSTSTYGYEIHNVEEILVCSLAHDAMHYGVALSQRKIV